MSLIINYRCRWIELGRVFSRAPLLHWVLLVASSPIAGRDNALGLALDRDALSLWHCIVLNDYPRGAAGRVMFFWCNTIGFSNLNANTGRQWWRRQRQTAMSMMMMGQVHKCSIVQLYLVMLVLVLVLVLALALVTFVWAQHCVCHLNELILFKLFCLFLTRTPYNMLDLSTTSRSHSSYQLLPLFWHIQTDKQTNKHTPERVRTSWYTLPALTLAKAWSLVCW